MSSTLRRFAFLILLSMSHSVAHADVTLGFGPASQTSSSLQVSIVVAGLGEGAAPSLAAFDLDVLFDTSRLVFGGATFGDPVLGNQLDLAGLGDNLQAASLDSPGRVNLFESSLDLTDDLNALQADSFTLATLTFGVAVTGDSVLELVGHALADGDGNAIPAQVTGTTIRAVPLAPSLLWMSSGLISLAGLFCRKQGQPQPAG